MKHLANLAVAVIGATIAVVISVGVESMFWLGTSRIGQGEVVSWVAYFAVLWVAMELKDRWPRPKD